MRVVIGFVVLAVAAGCPSGLAGTPCREAGAEECDELAPLVCDGRRWQQVGDCASRCALGVKVHDETEVSSDATWGCAEGVHRVPGTITIAAGATLTIEAGALMEMEQASRLVAEPEGRIVAKATNANPILFTSQNQVLGGYGAANQGGVNVFANSSSAPSELDNVIIERAIHGLGLFGLADGVDPPIIVNSTFRDNQRWGVLVRGCQGTPTIPDLEAAQNLFIENGEDPPVSQCDPDL